MLDYSYQIPGGRRRIFEDGRSQGALSGKPGRR